MHSNPPSLTIIGAGLAGSEAAFQAAELGVKVKLYEMRPKRMTPAHKTGACAELVCSNSFRSDDHDFNAVGLLHHELRHFNSLIMKTGDQHALPAGGALAVDRDLFSESITRTLQTHPNIDVIYEECLDLDQFGHDEQIIIATGPLTSDALSQQILKLTGEKRLAFFDAIAPIVFKDTINMDRAWYQSRYDKTGSFGTGKDYINCPFSKDEYLTFVAKLVEADVTEFKEWEKNTPYFEACLPIEVMAARGPNTLRFGPMKPIGLCDPHTGQRPYAVLQLRQDNAAGTLYNLVGFQTKIKYGDQKEIFSLIPGLEEAEFARMGGIHRNSFIKSPILLNDRLQLKSRKNIRFAGQITGVEGYVESAAIGLLAGRFAAFELLGQNYQTPPKTMALGALLQHITNDGNVETFQPMNVNFGLFEEMPEIPPKVKGRERKKYYTVRAKKELISFGFAA